MGDPQAKFKRFTDAMIAAVSVGAVLTGEAHAHTELRTPDAPIVVRPMAVTTSTATETFTVHVPKF